MMRMLMMSTISIIINDNEADGIGNQANIKEDNFNQNDQCQDDDKNKGRWQ